MIKASDVRLGNCVKIMDDERIFAHLRGKIVEVTIREITEIDNISQNCYEPIPLTPEILEGCGFESMEGAPLYRKFVDGGQVLFQDKELVLHVNGQKFELVIKCQYLHELQNIIYWIVKEELEVNLPVTI